MPLRPVKEGVGGKKDVLALSAGFSRTLNTPPESLLEGAVVAAALDGVVDQENPGFCGGACGPDSVEAGLAKTFGDGLDAQEKVGACVFGVGWSAAGALKMDGAEENGFAGAEPNGDLFVLDEAIPFVVGGF